MKVMLLNGSPHDKGCTARALSEIAATLEENGVESEIFNIGNWPVGGCTACGACRKAGKCVYNDVCNQFTAKMAECDGIIVGTPVYYASPNGSLIALLDRAFYSAGRVFAKKPAAVVASARRAGTTASLDVINKYFTINGMPVVSSSYWNMVHGFTAEDVEKDAEGLQTMRNLARNMAWILKCIEAGEAAGIEPPEDEKGNRTNFIR